jgi:hypothetical protein
MTNVLADVAKIPSTRDERDALTRLTAYSWTATLSLIIGLMLLSFLVAGLFVVYWRNADMDFIVIYNALLLNDGKPAFFSHPAYVTILAESYWFKLLKAIGVLDFVSLSNVPPASDTKSFAEAMTALIRWARVLVCLMATGLVLTFGLLVRAIVRDWRLAGVATFAFAFSGGMQFHLRMLRSEMLAAGLVVIGLLFLLLAARRATKYRPLLMGAAAFLCTIGYENKVQVVFLIAALPVICLMFGTSESGSVKIWTIKPPNVYAFCATVFIAGVAAVLFACAFPLINLGYQASSEMADLHPIIFGRIGPYQIGIIVWIVIGLFAFATIWRVAPLEFFASFFAIVAGASLALLTLYVQLNPKTLVVLMNPLEEMIKYADSRAISVVDEGSVGGGIGLLLSGVLGVLRRYTFVLFSSPRPTVFLTWLVIPGVIYAWRRSERQIALQAAVLICCAIGIDALGIRRGLKAEYFIITDPLIILSGLILLEKFPDLRFAKWAYPVGVSLIVLHIVISQAEPVKKLTSRRGPEGICEWNTAYLPLMPVPWCDQAHG